MRPPSGAACSEARARGQREVTGLPKRGLCSAPRPHCELPSSPRPFRTPSLHASPVCFSSLEPSTGTHQQSSGRCQRPEAVAQGRPESRWAWRASSSPSGRGVRGEGARGLSGILGQGSARPGGGRMGRMASAGGQGPSPGLRRARAACAAAHPSAAGPRLPILDPQRVAPARELHEDGPHRLVP